MGGPMNIYEHGKYPWLANEKRFLKQAIDTGKIILGICLGAQLLADVLGGKVYPNKWKEIGWFPVWKTSGAKCCSAFKRFPSLLHAFHWHGDTFELPPGAVLLASSGACENQAFAFRERVLGLQFHLETTRTGAEQLITHCGDEIEQGPYSQNGEQMLAGEERFEKINDVMTTVLDDLFGASGKVTSA